ncbi:MAG: hypothetical protein J7502_18050 [Flavisolibacter sp.]|nr:hypothetical protein [Flavisolibacter sp.]
MRKISFCLFAILYTTCSFSQTNLEAYGSFIRNFTDGYNNSTQGIGIRIEFGREDAFLTKYFGLAYTFPMYPTDVIEAHAFDNWTTPSYVNVTARYKQSMVRLEGGGKYYLSGDASTFEGVNWYLNGGAEVIYITNTPTYSYYDKENYTLGYTDDSDVNPDGTEKFGLNLHLSVGTGVEKNLGPGNIFCQAGFAFPVVRTNQQAGGIESFTPLPLNLNLGYKIPLGRR